MKSIKTGFVVITRPRQTWAACLLLACAAGRTLSLSKHLWRGAGLAVASVPCYKHPLPLPFPSQAPNFRPTTPLFTPPPPITLLSVSVRKKKKKKTRCLVHLWKFLQAPVRVVPKIIDIAFSGWQTRLSGHFFHFPALGESSAIPPFLLHFPRE